MKAPAHVLVVEDDASVADVVETYLSAAGLDVEAAADGVSALAAAARTRPDLVILDLMLPGLSGLEVCARLRQTRPDVPIIMLTALGEEDDRLLGLQHGADDYVVKPFSPRELVLRVQAVLRRAGPPGALAGTGQRRLLARGVSVDVAARTVSRRGEPVALTVREFDLLVHLMCHPGTVFTREQLMRHVWGWEFGDTSTVTVHVRRLREKIEADPGDPQLLATVWGAGYRWEGG